MAKSNTLKEMKKFYGTELENTYPSTDECYRSGRIRKMVRIASYSGWQSKHKSCTLAYEVDTELHTISVHWLNGAAPYAEELFELLLSDRDVKREVIEYQKRGRKDLYKMVRRDGRSGCKDVSIIFGQQVGNFCTKTKKHLLHVSTEGKLNEGFGDENCSMYIGDFVEVAAVLGYAKVSRSYDVRRKLKAKYLIPNLVEELEQFTTEVTQLF